MNSSPGRHQPGTPRPVRRGSRGGIWKAFDIFHRPIGFLIGTGIWSMQPVAFIVDATPASFIAAKAVAADFRCAAKSPAIDLRRLRLDSAAHQPPQALRQIVLRAVDARGRIIPGDFEGAYYRPCSDGRVGSLVALRLFLVLKGGIAWRAIDEKKQPPALSLASLTGNRKSRSEVLEAAA